MYIRVLGKDISDEWDCYAGIKKLKNAIESQSHEDQLAIMGEFFEDIRDLARIRSNQDDVMYRDPLYSEIVHDEIRANIDDFIEDMESYGLLNGKECYLMVNDSDHPHDFMLFDASSTASTLTASLSDNDNNPIRIMRTGDKPYLTVDVYDKPKVRDTRERLTKSYHVVPMKWLEKALESDIGKDIKTIMAMDSLTEAAVYKEVPELLEGKEALYALRNYVKYEAVEFPEKNHEVASRLGRLNFLKLRETAENQDVNRAAYFVHEALFPEPGEEAAYLLPTPEDKKLIAGIEKVLNGKDVMQIRDMVENLFSKNRVNEVAALRTLGTKDKSLAK